MSQYSSTLWLFILEIHASKLRPDNTVFGTLIFSSLFIRSKRVLICPFKLITHSKYFFNST